MRGQSTLQPLVYGIAGRTVGIYYASHPFLSSMRQRNLISLLCVYVCVRIQHSSYESVRLCADVDAITRQES